MSDFIKRVIAKMSFRQGTLVPHNVYEDPYFGTNLKRFMIMLSSFKILVIGLVICFFGLGCKHKPVILVEDFIYSIDNPPTPQCHASTIAASGDFLVASWFGGTEEKNKDVGIWIARNNGTSWSEPVEVANGIQNDTLRYPCWNPVLFRPDNAPLMLFYKVGPSPRDWWGMVMTSEDHGKTWSKTSKLPDGIYGPIKNKPIQLENGDILCPTSTEHDGWKVQIETLRAIDNEWLSSGDLNDGKLIGAIQPSILVHTQNKLQILCRTRQGFISESWSEDNGLTWSEIKLMKLPNPNSGIDAVSLKDGRHLLVYNPTGGDWGARVPLSLAISNDGKLWERIIDLESVTNPDTIQDEEYSYPSIIQTDDEMVHIVYTWNRKTVKHIALDPSRI